MKKIFMILILLIMSKNLEAQTIEVSTSFVNRYVWRGLDIANTPNLQPSLSLKLDGFETGIWGSYTLSNNRSVSDEIDYWVSYSFPYEFGNIALLVTDYYFPNSGVKISNFNNGDGAHTLEATLIHTGVFSFQFSYNFYNDIGNNMYYEIGYRSSIEDIDLQYFIGGTFGSKKNPEYYGSDKHAIINLGIKGTRNLTLNDGLVFPVSTIFVVNPQAEIAYLIFEITI